MNTIAIVITCVLIVATLFGIGIYVHENKGRNTITELNIEEQKKEYDTAYFAGGCFWCVEGDFEKIPDVIEAISGYMGGEEESPTYEQVSSGATNHRESVKIVYDSEKVDYDELVRHFFRHIDPTDSEGSFYDRGNQYTSAIYYQNEEEKMIAENIIKELNNETIFDKEIVTKIEPAGTFWQAEDYHQDYYEKNPIRYKYYRGGSGRDTYIEDVWEGVESDQSDWKDFTKPSDEELKESLTEIQFYVTQKDGTEKPFQNEYWDNHQEGIYVDVVSGEPLFSSTEKYDSGTGWPSFLKPIDSNFVTEHDDYKLFTKRTEIRSKIADSHLGHIILDGPENNNKIRYCMNSASLEFIPKSEMKEKGYEDFLSLF